MSWTFGSAQADDWQGNNGLNKADGSKDQISVSIVDQYDWVGKQHEPISSAVFFLTL